METTQKDELLEKVLLSYKRYYDINTENPTQPFAAEAEFHAKNEQYFLVKSVKMSEIDSNEYVFFAREEELTDEKLKVLADTAWKTGTARVHPAEGHRNSDVTLIVLCNSVTDDARKKVRKTKHYKSYLFTFRGWSHFKLAVMEISTGKLFFNSQGKELKKTLKSVI